MGTGDELLGAPPEVDPIERAQILAGAAARLLGDPPPMIDRFEIRARIGGGALGVVFAAWDPRLEREVAIKLLRSASGGPERLLAEARAMAKLSDANVVTVHEVGVVEDRVLLVMERIHGGTLRGWIDARERGWREIVATFVAAGRGLAAAHRVGLVHRDFKPDNVLVAGDPPTRVLVTDFGLARSADDRDAPAGVGTPAYMAPEQHDGAAVGAAADQFAFCVALYEALWRRRPFAGEELARDKAEGRVIAPPRNSTIPAWLRDAVLRGLSPTPAERWPHMDALCRVLGSDPARTRLRRLGIVAIVVVALVATVGATLQMIVFWDWYMRARP
ncbi:MAG TPA: serine/threonine-protein kinase [Nannocystaceae bacterium]|nr:serine/threonine-protein kinase [Nannocystaceae bacterium]